MYELTQFNEDTWHINTPWCTATSIHFSKYERTNPFHVVCHGRNFPTLEAAVEWIKGAATEEWDDSADEPDTSAADFARYMTQVEYACGIRD